MEDSIIHRITQLDREYGTVSTADDEALYSSPTHTSFYQIIKDAQLMLSPDTVFVDLGSGMGSILFFMYDKYPQLKKYVGVEYNNSFVREAQRRQALLHIPEERVENLPKDILSLDVSFLNALQAQHLVLFSFDLVMPKAVVRHIYENLFLPYTKHVVWLSTYQFLSSATKLPHQIVFGAPGLSENDPNVFVLNSDKNEEGEIDNPLPPGYMKALTSGKEIIEMEGVSLYRHERNAEMIGACVWCGLEEAEKVCSICWAPYCSDECAETDWKIGEHAKKCR